jgi:hypothetical protein
MDLIERWIPTTGDEGRDYAAIEKAAAAHVRRGWEPIDSEPGEWLRLLSPDGKTEIEFAIQHGQDNTSYVY